MAVPGIALKLISLQTMVQKASEAREQIDTYNLEVVANLFKKIHEGGLELVRATVLDSKFLDGFFTPVMLKLEESVSYNLTQHENLIHSSLSKAYRIFIELTWYKCWDAGFKIDTADRDKIIESAKKRAKTYYKNSKETSFEYTCAKQAAKCLIPLEMWRKYVDGALDVGEAAEGESVFGLIKAIKNIATIVKKDWCGKWYLDVFELRWLATLVKTPDDFKDKIQKVQSSFEDKGGEYTKCLATIYKELIKDPTVEAETKKLAANGFVRLLKLKDLGKITHLIDKALNKKADSKQVQWVAKKWDSYYQTRLMIMEYLGELAKDPAYSELIAESVKTLVEIRYELRTVDEQNKIQTKLDSIKKADKELSEYIKEAEDYVQEYKNRANEEEEVKQAELDLEAAKTQKDTLLIIQSIAEKSLLEQLKVQEEEEEAFFKTFENILAKT